MMPDVSDYLASKQSQMVALLEKLVLIQSGTRNKAGVDRVVQLIGREFEPLPVCLQTLEQASLGNHLIVRSEADDATGGRILLVGHMDTVFPEDTDFNWFKRDARHCYGPGVSDMKGGLVVGIFAIKALAACGLLNRLPLTLVFNSDEEIGSPGSGDLVRQQARTSAAAFVLESAGPAGEIVTGRKGNLSTRLDVNGRAGHAAFAGSDKASAILELAHKIVALERLNNPAEGVTVNVGKVDGGIGPNTVAEIARAWVDCRFVTDEQRKELERRIAAIAAQSTLGGTHAALEIVSGRPPMPQNENNAILYDIVKTAGAELNQIIGDEFRQGVSDANLIAAENIPVVDGLGPLGGKDHSKDEYMVLDSLIQRATLLAHAIVAAHRHFSS